MKRILAVALAALVVTAGAVAAAPGNSGDTPADGTPGADATDGDANQSVTDRPGANAPDVDRGPSVDLPDPVPQHVQQIHDAIQQFLDGALDGVLGDEVSSVTPDDSDAPANATTTTADS